MIPEGEKRTLTEIVLVESDGSSVTIWDVEDGDPWDALTRWIERCSAGFRVIWEAAGDGLALAEQPPFEWRPEHGGPAKASGSTPEEQEG